VCRALAEEARSRYTAAERVLQARPRGRLLAPHLMAAACRARLEEMTARGSTPPRVRVSLGKLRLLSIVARVGLLR
jgi:presqualene diphosphate synthase